MLQEGTCGAANILGNIHGHLSPGWIYDATGKELHVINRRP